MKDTSPEWIAAVSGTGTPFYTRLIPGGLDRVPGVAEALAEGCRVVDTDVVSLSLKDETSQAVMKPVGAEGYDYTYVIMPMRI